ncbi:MAG: hypothetical protein HDT43_11920 [Ruminococcaceae bacterium]|nr:hypothetical protein [Oscillospiraceae bacterium]
MSDIRTVTLDGAEFHVEGLGGQNTAIINKSGGAVYASVNPNIVPEGDNVIEIAAGDRDGLYNTNGSLYLLGTGKVELRGTDYSVNFRKPSRSADSGGAVFMNGTAMGLILPDPVFLTESADTTEG